VGSPQTKTNNNSPRQVLWQSKLDIRLTRVRGRGVSEGRWPPVVCGLYCM